jgi:formyl-CoA transferase
MVADVPHPTAGSFKMVASPMKLSETPCEIKRHPPLLGEHTDELLAEVLGYDTEKISSLKENGVI